LVNFLLWIICLLNLFSLSSFSADFTSSGSGSMRRSIRIRNTGYNRAFLPANEMLWVEFSEHGSYTSTRYGLKRTYEIINRKKDKDTTSVVDTDPHGSGTFCRIRIRNSRFRIRIRVRVQNWMEKCIKNHKKMN
jgi:hypothetical protein